MWIYSPIIIGIILLSIIGILYEYNKLSKEKSIKLAFIVFYTCVFVILEYSSYINTRSINDYLVLNLATIIYGILIFILYKKIEQVHILVNILLITGFAFILAIVVNYFFIKPIQHSIWMIPIASYYAGSVSEKYKNKTINRKEIFIYGLIVVVMLMGLFKIFDESIYGTSRAAREIKTFLIEQEGYKKEEIDKMKHCIYNFPHKKGFPEPVEVRFSNGESVYYEYKNNRINETTWENIMKNL